MPSPTPSGSTGGSRRPVRTGAGSYRALLGGGLVDAYRQMQPVANEYSWVGKTGDGYRYDHVFVSTSLAGQITDCTYLHACRVGPDAFTDHSGLSARLAHPAPAPLSRKDPAADQQPTQDKLF